MHEIKRIPVRFKIKEFLFTFEYETWKGKKREQQRTIKHFDKESAKECFKKWYENIRTMSNVQILGVVELADRGQVIEL